MATMKGKILIVGGYGSVGRIISTSFPSGVFHVEQLFDPSEFIEILRGKGLSFSHSELKEA
jgi:hypothetical protein